MAGFLIHYMRAEPLFAFARPASELEAQAAVALYACAISRALGGDRKERRRLTNQAKRSAQCRRQREEADECEWGRYLKRGGVPDEAYTAFMVSECFDGGGPGGVSGANIPMEARILSVAEHWAALTAKGSPHLSHEEALGDLDACAGTRYDPQVVRAAHLAFERRLVNS
jgi:hypothetical protein